MHVHQPQQCLQLPRHMPKFTNRCSRGKHAQADPRLTLKTSELLCTTIRPVGSSALRRLWSSGTE